MGRDTLSVSLPGTSRSPDPNLPCLAIDRAFFIRKTPRLHAGAFLFVTSSDHPLPVLFVTALTLHATCGWAGYNTILYHAFVVTTPVCPLLSRLFVDIPRHRDIISRVCFVVSVAQS